VEGLESRVVSLALRVASGYHLPSLSGLECGGCEITFSPKNSISAEAPFHFEHLKGTT
jgi:hypothetical protein